MEAGIGATQMAGAGAGSAAPSPSPQYTPPPPPFNPMPQGQGGMSPVMEEGGAVGESSRKNPFKDFFSGINWLDTAIMAFIVAGVGYTIFYHKKKLMLENVGYVDLSTRLQRVEAQIASAKSKEMNATGGKGTIRRKRALITL